jgi:hypothetical protein
VSCVIAYLNALLENSGKLLLIDKLLPKLKAGGHKVLIFSQVIIFLLLFTAARANRAIASPIIIDENGTGSAGVLYETERVYIRAD